MLLTIKTCLTTRRLPITQVLEDVSLKKNNPEGRGWIKSYPNTCSLCSVLCNARHPDDLVGGSLDSGSKTVRVTCTNMVCI